MLRRQGDAQGARELHGPLPAIQQGAHGLEEPLAAFLHKGGVRHVFQEDHELVPADAADDIAAAEEVPQPLRRPGEDGVAVGMAATVVDLLEIVHVQDQQGGE